LKPAKGAMNPRFHRRFRAAEDPADLWKAQVLFKSEDEKGAVSSWETKERAPQLLPLDVSQGRGCRIKDRVTAASVT
jgi:hypothetical protein